MTTYSIVNQEPTYGSDVIFDVKGTLVSASWRVLSSSDGTTAYSGDCWSASSVGNNNYAWLIMQSPESGSRHVSFQRSNNHYDWRMQYLSGAYSNDGTSTALPTAAAGTIQWVLGDGSSYYSILDSSPNQRHHVIAVSGSHASTGSFWFGTFTKTTGAGKYFFAFDPVESHNSQDADPVCVCSLGANPSYNYLGSNTYSPLGMMGGSWSRMNVLELSNVDTYRVDGHGMGTNSDSSKIDLMPPVYGRFSSFGGSQGIKGYSTLFLLSGYTLLGFGDTLNVEGSLEVTGSKSHVVLGKYNYASTILPWDGSSDLTV